MLNWIVWNRTIFIKNGFGVKLSAKVGMPWNPNNQLLYSHIINMHIYTYTCRIHIDAIIKTSKEFFKKIYLSLYLKVCVWDGVGDRQNCNILTPTLVAISVVFLVLLGWSTGGLGAQLSAECWLSLPHLLSNSSGLQTNWLPVFTELYNSSTSTFFLWASQLHPFNPSTVKVIILVFLDRMHLFFT